MEIDGETPHLARARAGSRHISFYYLRRIQLNLYTLVYIRRMYVCIHVRTYVSYQDSVWTMHSTPHHPTDPQPTYLPTYLPTRPSNNSSHLPSRICSSMSRVCSWLGQSNLTEADFTHLIKLRIPNKSRTYFYVFNIRSFV